MPINNCQWESGIGKACFIPLYVSTYPDLRLNPPCIDIDDVRVAICNKLQNLETCSCPNCSKDTKCHIVDDKNQKGAVGWRCYITRSALSLYGEPRFFSLDKILWTTFSYCNHHHILVPQKYRASFNTKFLKILVYFVK